MKRKIVQHGPGTYTVSLPAEWVRKNKIKKGDEVEVEVGENAISISNKNIPRLRKIIIDATNLNSTQVVRRMEGSYLLGYDEIEVISKKGRIPFTSRFRGVTVKSGEIEIKEIITFVRDNVIGFEIVLNSQGNYILKECAGKSSLTFEECVSQIIHNINLAISHFSGKDRSRFEDFLDTAYFYEGKINSFAHLCQRMINKGELSFGSFNNVYYSLICYLEKLGGILYSTTVFSKNYSDDECKNIGLNLSILRTSLDGLFRNKESAASDYKKLREIQIKVNNGEKVLLPMLYLVDIYAEIYSLVETLPSRININ